MTWVYHRQVKCISLSFLSIKSKNGSRIPTRSRSVEPGCIYKVDVRAPRPNILRSIITRKPLGHMNFIGKGGKDGPRETVLGLYSSTK